MIQPSEQVWSIVDHNGSDMKDLADHPNLFKAEMIVTPSESEESEGSDDYFRFVNSSPSTMADSPSIMVEWRNTFNMRPTLARVFRARQLSRPARFTGLFPLISPESEAMRSLDLLRVNLQHAINKDIQGVLNNYLERFFQPAVENIRVNLGEETALDRIMEEHVRHVCEKFLEDAKQMYRTPALLPMCEKKGYCHDEWHNRSDEREQDRAHLYDNHEGGVEEESHLERCNASNRNDDDHDNRGRECDQKHHSEPTRCDQKLDGNEADPHTDNNLDTDKAPNQYKTPAENETPDGWTRNNEEKDLVGKNCANDSYYYLGKNCESMEFPELESSSSTDSANACDLLSQPHIQAVPSKSCSVLHRNLHTALPDVTLTGFHTPRPPATLQQISRKRKDIPEDSDITRKRCRPTSVPAATSSIQTQTVPQTAMLTRTQSVTKAVQISSVPKHVSISGCNMHRMNFFSPQWNPSRVTADTLFIMGARCVRRANKLLGYGQTRGRLYTKHHDLFKYAGDQEDKEWLAKNNLILPSGGKAFLCVMQDIYELAVSNEYKNNPNINLEELKGFRVPEFMLQKIRSCMRSVRNSEVCVTSRDDSSLMGIASEVETPTATKPLTLAFTPGKLLTTLPPSLEALAPLTRVINSPSQMICRRTETSSLTSTSRSIQLSIPDPTPSSPFSVMSCTSSGY